MRDERSQARRGNEKVTRVLKEGLAQFDGKTERGDPNPAEQGQVQRCSLVLAPSRPDPLVPPERIRACCRARLYFRTRPPVLGLGV